MSTCLLRGGKGGDDVRCPTQHDSVATGLSAFLLVGLVVSYLPQILRIIWKKSSLGFSPWFLLLGATSSASSFLNVLALQWGLVQCCSVVSASLCAESMLGIAQVGLQWALFVTILILFLIYYPKEMRYERSIALPARGPAGSLADPEESGESGWSEDIDDSDALDSQFDPTAEASGISVSGFDAMPTDSAIQTYQNDSIRGPAEDISSSAFARLVPTFWPVWKAPPGKRGAVGPPGRQTASGGFTPIGAEGGASLRPPAPSGDGSQLLHAALTNAHNQSHGISTSHSAVKAWKRALKRKSKQRTPEWSLSIALAWVVLLHFFFIFLITLLLVASLPTSAFPDPSNPSIPSWIPAPPSWLSPVRQYASEAVLQVVKDPSGIQLLVQRWAAFLGVTGTALAAGQYIPQIIYTARAKLVGSLSIPTMCLQVPGSIIFVYSLAIRPGTDWSSLAAFIATGVLQLILLILCFTWKARQKRLGLDDFGRPIGSVPEEAQVNGNGGGEGSIRLNGDD